MRVGFGLGVVLGFDKGVFVFGGGVGRGLDLEGFVAEREADLIELFAIEGVSEAVGVAVEAG